MLRVYCEIQFGYLVLFSASLCCSVLCSVVSCDFLTYATTHLVSETLSINIEECWWFRIPEEEGEQRLTPSSTMWL